MTEVTWHSHVHQCTSNLKDADSSWKQVLDHFHINLDITGPWLAYKALCKLEKGISYKKANHKEVPPLQPIPGILQARTLEWLAISSSNV